MLRILIIAFAIFLCNKSSAQDTLIINRQQADSLFLSNNLLLLSQKYQVDAAKAAIKQAKLWDNPTLNSEWNFYNPNKKQYFDIGSTGQKVIGIEQLITIAGKRNKRIELAKANAQYNEFEFDELMRTLKLELHSSFQTVYFNAITISKYDEQLNLLNTIIDALQFQNKKGNIPLKEVLRLKAVYYQLNNDRTDLFSEMLEAQKKLQILLQTPFIIKPTINTAEYSRYNLSKLEKQQLVLKAISNRPDLKMAESLQKQNNLNYALQKKLAIPDFRIGGSYDQAGSYINNYTAVTFGMDLPFLNRNQGNIAVAKAQTESSKKQLEYLNSAISYEVLASFAKLQQVDAEYRKVDEDFSKNFETLNEGYFINFQKRNISMIEFVDFFEAYNTSILQINKLNEKRIQTYEELNYVVGEELFKN